MSWRSALTLLDDGASGRKVNIFEWGNDARIRVGAKNEKVFSTPLVRMNLAKDTDLKALRKREDFKAFVAEVQKEAPKPPDPHP